MRTYPISAPLRPRHLWMRNGLVWATLLGLLLLSFGSAYVPLGPMNAVVGVVIAFTKAGLVAVFFMELRTSRPLTRLAACFAMLFVFVMFALTLMEVVARVRQGWAS